MWVSDGGIGCPPVLGSRLSAKKTRPSYQVFFRKWRFSGGDVCGVQLAKCRVLAIPNGTTQLGDGTTTNSTVPSKVGGNW